MKPINVETYKMLKALQEAGLADKDGNILPSVEEGARGVLKFFSLMVAIPAIAAIVTTTALLGGTGAVMLLWWLLFV